MKKTSIVFLVISVLLIVSGILIKGQGEKMAEKENIKLFRQELTDEGDLIETIEFSGEDVNKFFIELEETEVNIFGNSDKNYIEIINFSTLEYSAYPNNHTFNIKSDLISSLTGRAEGGKFSFNGVRDYVRFEEHNPEKRINIYLTSDCSVKSFTLNITNGNINITDVDLLCDYNINLDTGDIKCSETPTASLFMCTLKNGNVAINECFIKRTDIKIENGNITFSTPSAYIYDYTVEAEAGKIVYNGETHQGTFSIYNEECNGDFNAHVGVGSVDIKTTDTQPVVPSTPAENQPEETENA